jgi:nitroimidazol reductase NimA-like FMN-containing flavoprotein (pyridoxamine 5'-phosphate oxidase superfamily)
LGRVGLVVVLALSLLVAPFAIRPADRVRWVAEREGAVSLAMTKQEREAFLADPHVGIISIAEEGRGPLTVPIWYSYAPDGEVRVVTGRTSRKAQLIRRAGRFSLRAQTETPPYKYVSVEGPIVAIEPANLERDRRPLARGCFGVQAGDRYIERTQAETVENVLVRMRPERWLTVDYGKV